VVPWLKAQQNPYEKFFITKPFTVRERLGGEKDTLGLYLTGHPIDEYEDELKHMLPQRIVDLRRTKKNPPSMVWYWYAGA
jgi:DNA polymerase-3 subunit alpha